MVKSADYQRAKAKQSVWTGQLQKYFKIIVFYVGKNKEVIIKRK